MTGDNIGLHAPAGNCRHAVAPTGNMGTYTATADDKPCPDDFAARRFAEALGDISCLERSAVAVGHPRLLLLRIAGGGR
jgi:hypothetical protein